MQKKIIPIIVIFAFVVLGKIIDKTTILDAIFTTTKKSTLDFWKTFSDIVSTIMSSLILSITSIRVIYKHEIYKKQFEILLIFHKVLFIKNIHKKFKLKLSIDVRIFLPKKNNPNEFTIKNIDGFYNLGDDTTKNLVFDVTITEGLVGLAYTKKDVVLDRDLQKSTVNYNLRGYNRDNVSDLSFCLCVPIRNNNDDIVAVMAFDSKEPLNIKDTEINDFKKHFKKFAIWIYQNVPQLFRF